MQDQEPPIFGDFRALAYFYADVFVGSPPQKFSVITDTGSTRLAVPCKGCTNCGRHQNPPFDPQGSTTCRPATCDTCYSCNSHQQCTYSVSYAEGSSISGVLYDDMVWMGEDTSSSEYGAQHGTQFRFGCHTSETSA